MLYIGDCQSYEQRTPYIAIRTPLRHLLGVRGWGDEAADAALEQRVEQLAPELARFTPLLGDVLSIELPETPLTQALTPEQRQTGYKNWWLR